MADIVQKIKDWWLERRIKQLGHKITACIKSGDYAAARELDQQRVAAIKHRSPSQVSRMERRVSHG